MDENPGLQSEIVRLNRIITILIDEIELLKQENTYLRRNSGKIRNKSSVVSSDSGINLNKPSVVIHNDGNYLNKPPTIIHDDGNNLNKVPTVIHDDGNNLNKPSAVLSEEWHLAKNISTVIPVSEQLQPAVSTKKQAPSVIEFNPKNERLLGFKLKKFFHVRIKEKSLLGMARELLVMHNNGFADSKELRKATELTVSGFAKHFPMIKRKGLVYKQGVRKYALTPTAKALVDEAFGV